MAVKTSSQVGLLRYQDKDFSLEYMISNDQINTSKSPITALEFLQHVTPPDQKMLLLIGFKTGKVVVYNVSTRQVHLKFNIQEEGLPNSPTGPSQSVARFLQYPPNFCSQQQYAVLYADSLMVAFESGVPKVESVQESRRQLQKQNNPKIKHCLHPTAENRFRLLEEDKQMLLKLNCQTVSDLELVGDRRMLQYLDCGLKRDKDGQMSPFLLAYCGFDGYFRLADLVLCSVVLTVKSYFGGFNALTFSPDFTFLALAGQDDCATIVSMENKGYIRLFQHTSFVSRVLFSEPQQNSLMIVSGSLDCKVGLYYARKDFLREQMRAPQQNQDQVDVVVAQDQLFTIDQAHFYPLAKDAIGWLTLLQDLLVLSNYDGSVIVYDFTLAPSLL